MMNGSDSGVNETNEITDIDDSDWVTPAYDDAGNLVESPVPGDETTKVHYVYDGWNRLVAVYDDDSGEPDDLLSSYEYDGLGRRIEKAVTAAGGGARDVDYFYDKSWQLLESRQTAGAVDSVDQYVWDVTYIDAPILRFHDGNADGDLEDAGDTVRYFTWDANHNVTAALEEVDSTWQVVERYVYSPYGEATVYDDDWSTSSAPSEDGPLYAGYFFDSESALYHVRARMYHATLGNFTQRDPLDYAAGDENLYRYVSNGCNPNILTLPEWKLFAAGETSKAQVIEWFQSIGSRQHQNL